MKWFHEANCVVLEAIKTYMVKDEGWHVEPRIRLRGV